MKKKSDCFPCHLGKRLKKIILIMKLTAPLMIFAMLNVSATIYSQNTHFTFDLTDVTIKDVFNRIESNSNFKFLYRNELINVDRKVSVTANQESVESILGKLFGPDQIDYMIFEDNMIVITNKKQQKQNTVTGTVTDVASGETLPGVNVTVQGTSIGAVTDLKGFFTIDVPDANAVLVFSFVGYNTETVSIAGQSKIDVTMVPDIKSLDEVVVIGYGSRQKADLTGAVSSIDAKELNTDVKMSPELQMQGKMAGVLISSTGSSPTARPEVRIRGVGTLGFNDPLYVIDGVPLTEGGSTYGDGTWQADFRGTINVFNMINPDDIESISVLKDASATAVYGVRASNGVILITTKRGQKGKPNVNFSASYGIKNITRRRDMMNTQQFTDAHLEAWANNPTVTPAPETFRFFDPTSAYYLGNSPTYTSDWVDFGLKKNAPVQNYDLSISGGNDASNFFVGAGYSSEEDAVFYNKFDRYSFSLNSDHKLTKWLKVGESYRFVYTNNDRQNLTGAAGLEVNPDYPNYSYTPPWQPLYDNGSAEVNGYKGWALPGRTIDGTLESQGYGPGTRINPGNYTNDYWQNKMLRNLGSFYAEVSPVNGLKIKGTFSFDRYSYHQEVYNQGREGGLFDPQRGYLTDLSQANAYTIRDNINTNIVKELLINYTRSFGEHNFDITLNGMDQRVDWTTEQKAVDQYSPISSWDQRRISDNVSRENRNVTSGRGPSGLQGYMARMSYNYHHKYYLDATVRRDGSSKFGPGYKWGTFPSFAAAWRITSEGFMRNISWLDDLKFRAGWGQVGNQETRDAAYVSLVNLSTEYAFGSVIGGNNPSAQGIALTDFPTIDMSWETSTTKNVGFDAVMLSNRLSLTAEYYNRLTDGILQSIEIPLVIGASSQPVVNLAKVSNRGIEIQGSWQDKIGPVGYNISFNITTVKNEVMDLYRNRPSGDNWGRIEEGYSMNFLYGYETDGIFQTDQDVSDWLAVHSDPGYEDQKAPGDVRFVDINSAPTEADGPEAFVHYAPDSIINAYDQTYLGKTIPGYYYGFSLGANFRNWDVNMIFRGVGDVQGINETGKLSIDAGGDNFETVYLDRWTPENHSNTIPRAIAGDPSGNNRISDRMVENRGFLRFQTAQLGYTFSGNILNKVGASNLRCYASASNIFVMTPWTGIDPENDNTPFVFTVGANLSF